MTPYAIGALAWQESWDRQQEAYLPDREERFAAMLDTVAAVDAAAPAVLDLAGGTGSLSLRALRRFERASTTLLDMDPVLLSIARASLGQRSTVVRANLREPGWIAALPRRDYTAVLTATALHWLPAGRLAELYAEIRQVLRPGGVFVNADHMPDPGIPALSARLEDQRRARREARYAAGAVLSWDAWWGHVAKDPVLGPQLTLREKVFAGGHDESSDLPVTWHLDALRAAGYTEVGVVWRAAGDAAAAGVR